VAYEVAFVRDGKRYEVAIAGDGTIIETEQEHSEADSDEP
jgi:uncharacterized membrane protein YkoI